MLLLLLHYAPAVVCGVHCVRTGQNMYWLWLLMVGGSLGAAIYFFAVMAPDLAGGRTGRTAAKAVKRLVNPQADYARALKELEETPTAGARIKAAHAAEALGRWDDAEAQWTLAASGLWADDPVVLAGHANALIELGRYEDALQKLEALQEKGEGDKGLSALAFARCYEGLGRVSEAEAPYRYAADHVPGLEAGARYVAFMARTGRAEDARTGLVELDRRLKRISPALRGEARVWRDLAAQAIAETDGAGRAA
ncbi:MAG: hypothetical protein K2Q06_00480 [Parvularculaceae bacterium]|nr:hypothetical protein [Parvularculaceae bacterium]